jgi:hypothetical protein
VSHEKSKPALDEQTFSKLLEAAYVMQEHNRGKQKVDLPSAPKGKSDPTPIKNPATSPPEPKERSEGALPLEKIVATQHEIHVRHLGLEDALQLVADRVADICNGSGSAIALVEGTVVRYHAVSGETTPPAGITVALTKSLSASCLKTGKTFRSKDASRESGLDSQECAKRQIRSLIAVPIFHGGNVAGALELYYAAPNAFTDHDVHSCQLLAGLVTEALAREEEINSKKSLASERAAMLEALEKLQPNLAALIDKPVAKNSPAPTLTLAESKNYSCRKCGHQLVMDEQFCGKCGSPRAGDYEAPSMQSKVASLWEMQTSQSRNSADEVKRAAERENAASPSISSDENSQAIAMEKQLLELLAMDDDALAKDVALARTDKLVTRNRDSAEIDAIEEVREQESFAVQDVVPGEELRPSETSAPAHPVNGSHWTSAASAREFLEKLVSSKQRGPLLQLWNTHRGDIYLAVAIVLVVCVIGWGFGSSHAAKGTQGHAATSSASREKASPDSDLSFFDRVLVQLGLAEPPPAKEDKGSPGVQVWVDIHTALYYCPGTEMYGKTPQGKFTTQRQAQLDQFEPAYRKVCR